MAKTGLLVKECDLLNSKYSKSNLMAYNWPSASLHDFREGGKSMHNLAGHI